MADEPLTPHADVRTHLAWLMWCFNEGYTKAEDRRGVNWLLEETLHPDDVVLRQHLLEMADEVLSALTDEPLRTIEVQHWRGMTLRDQILEWRERALEAEAERDRLRALLDEMS